MNDRKLEALIKATTNDMQKAETAVLRMADDQYRKIIYNAQVYANTGAGTYERAVDMATKDFLSSGLNCIQYANGARHTLADYADMALRTASKRAYLAGEGEKRQENKRFQESIAKCEEKVHNQRDEIAQWFASGGKHVNNIALSDIVDALSRGDISVPFGHGSEYWKHKDNRSAEIFAEISAIDSLSLAGEGELQGTFAEIYDSYKEMIGI